MKQIITISILLIFIHIIGFAQSFVSENKLWSNTFIGTEIGSEYSSYFIKLNGDTTIDGTSYKFVLRSEDINHEIWYKFGVIREDTINKKVFQYNLYEHEDELLYDFNLNSGDSIFSDYRYIKVDTVIFAPFGNSSNILKQIHLNANGENTIWIEGIGSMNGILNGISSFGYVGAYNYLVCFSENDSLLYQNPNFDDCFPLEFPNLIERYDQEPNDNLDVFYDDNKIEFILKRAVKSSKSKLQIFSVKGNKVYETALQHNNKVTISKENFEQGLYIYRFTNSNKLIQSGKIIVK